MSGNTKLSIVGNHSVCNNRNIVRKDCISVQFVPKNVNIFFEKIIDGKMNLSEIGRIVHSEWLKNAIHQTENEFRIG